MKRILTTFLTVCIFLGAYAQRPKVGLVLCGGGAKGAAHIGVLKVLEENGIPVDCIAGTSMGAIIGGLYSLGYTADELDSLILSQDWDVIMKDHISRSDVAFEQKASSGRFILNIPFGLNDTKRLSSKGGNMLDNIPMSIVKGNNVYNLLTRLTVGYQDSLDFNKLPIPFACVAVDLANKKEYVFHSGSIVEAIRSSMSLPGYFAPVRKGDMVLFDGGLLNNYPVDVVKKMGADIVIGVRLGGFDPHPEQINNIGDMANSLMDLYMDAKLAKAVEDTDILIGPDISGYSVLSFDKNSLTALVENGRKAAMEQKEALCSMRDSLRRAEDAFIGPLPKAHKKFRKAVCLGQNDTVTISSVQVNGLPVSDLKQILRHSRFKSGARLTGGMIEDEIEELYSTGAFASVNYSLSGEEEPYHMTLEFVQGPKSRLGVGVKFDSEEIASILLNIGLNEKALYGHKLSLTAKLAYNLQAEARYNYAFKNVAYYEFGYKFRNSNLNIINEGMRNNCLFRQHSLWMGFSTHRTKLTKTDFGLKMDWFTTDANLDAIIPYIKTYDYDSERDLFVQGYFKFALDKFDRDCFPTRGVRLDAGYSYFFSKLLNSDNSDFMVGSARFSFVAPIGDRFAMIGTIANRTVIGNDVPIVYMNIMGGNDAGRYMDQQMPFIGFNYTRNFRNTLTTANLDLRYRLFDNHYLYASGAWARDAQKIEDIFEGSPVWGASLGYSYDSIMGPLSLKVQWSNMTKVGVYLSLGYSF